jgi:hypothetical protein
VGVFANVALLELLDRQVCVSLQIYDIQRCRFTQVMDWKRGSALTFALQSACDCRAVGPVPPTQGPAAGGRGRRETGVPFLAVAA